MKQNQHKLQIFKHYLLQEDGSIYHEEKQLNIKKKILFKAPEYSMNLRITDRKIYLN
jgi:hypothetical protein